MEQIIGKVGITTEGTYDSNKAYEKLSCVTYNGASWVSNKDVPAGCYPGSDAEYWQKMAEKGEKGDTGPQGPQGNSAFDGTGVEIVNNLTDGGEAAVLSAEQGKILKTELTELESELLVNTRRFQIKVGTSHSALLDRIFCNIKSGEQFSVSCDSVNEDESLALQIYLFDNNNKATTSSYIRPSAEKVITAQFDISSIGLAVSSSDISIDNTITWSVVWGDGLTIEEDVAELKEDVAELKEDVAELKEDVADKIGKQDFSLFDSSIGANTKFFNLTPGVAHSSTDDRIFCLIKQGEEFKISYITATGDEVIRLQIYVYYYDGTIASIGYLAPNVDKIYTASNDIVSIGLYASPSDITVNDRISWSVVWGEANALRTTIENKIDVNDLLNNAFVNPYTEVSVEDKSLQFCSLFKTDCEADSYLFFTDPHLWDNDITPEERKKAIAILKKYYSNNPLSFIISGGDWLTQDDTQDIACRKLGEIGGIMHGLFADYLPVFGNHDNNYQGKLSAESDNNTGELPISTIRNLWFRQWGKTYYRYDNHNTSYIVLDDGSDWKLSMDEYDRWEQIRWLVSQLKENQKEHIVVCKHMYYSDTGSQVAIMSRNVIDLCAAFNNRESIFMYDTNYDFSDAVGRVEYMSVGHSHVDFDLVDKGIPVIGTINAYKNNVMSFDLRFVDYTNRILHCIRIGEGNDRHINL